MSICLVVGKFYPPHAGHVYLLEVALRRHEQAVVLCLGSSGDSFPPWSRLQALWRDAAAAGVALDRAVGRSGFDEAPFDVESDAVWQSHVEVFRAHLRGIAPVDAVVTSESYGAELARRLGVRHDLVDLDRVKVPVCSTQVRADPVAWWPVLGPGTRSLLATRVVIIGAESTGTTTVSRMLTERLRARGRAWSEVGLVEEYGRELTVSKQDRVEAATGLRPLSVQWSAEDFLDVVRVQTEREDSAAGVGGPVLVCDTDAFATPVWERRYLAEAARLDPSTLGRGDVYLLTDHRGVPFVQDGSRDGEHMRAEMTAAFAEALVEYRRPWAMLTGPLEGRLALAIRICDQVMGRKLTFTDPI